jgi:hypothetical protein
MCYQYKNPTRILVYAKREKHHHFIGYELIPPWHSWKLFNNEKLHICHKEYPYTNETLHSTNVAEKFALLFENEWKLAYEDLADRGYHDEECVYKLMRVIRVCLMSVSMNILLHSERDQACWVGINILCTVDCCFMCYQYKNPTRILVYAKREKHHHFIGYELIYVRHFFLIYILRILFCKSRNMSRFWDLTSDIWINLYFIYETIYPSFSMPIPSVNRSQRTKSLNWSRLWSIQMSDLDQ